MDIEFVTQIFLVFVIFAIITGIVMFYILQSTSEENISINEQINNENMK